MRVKPKKRLGQNFLIDKNIQKKIIKGLELKSSETVLEIGSGRGEFTVPIADRIKKVYAAEIDPDLYGALEENIKDYPNVVVIKKDILKLRLEKYFSKFSGKLNVFGNIPYYISTPIIEKLLGFRKKINTIYITVQKEFAKRIVAQPGSKIYGSLSCFVQYYTEPKIIFEIKKGSFYPMPKVDSCFLKLTVRRETALSKDKEKILFRIIRAAFNQRRKALRNSLKRVFPKEKLESYLQNYSIDKNTRPEDLTYQDFTNLINS